MNAMQIGRISEMIVATDLMKQGYDVYLGFYSQYDMIAVKHEMRYSVEVKTSKTMKLDRHRFKYKADICALVSPEGIIKYFYG